MKYLVPVLLIILVSFNVKGQSTSSKGRIEVEIDPLAYIFKGYSVHIGYQKRLFRYDAGVFAIETPKFFTDNKDFTEYANGAGVKVDYVGKKARGWFVGLQSDYMASRVTHDETRERSTGGVWGVGIRGGYRFMFGKAESKQGFYVVPWIGIDKLFIQSPVKFSEHPYQEQTMRIFPTIHLGWRF